MKFLWEILNRTIQYEQIVQFNSLLTIAKRSNELLNKNITEIEDGTNKDYRYSSVYIKHQNFLSPSGVKNYRTDFYRDLEREFENFEKYKKLLAGITTVKNEYDFKETTEGNFEKWFQFIAVFKFFVNKQNMNNEIELLKKTARRANYDLAHLASADKSMLHFFQYDNYASTFCVEGPSTRLKSIKEYTTYLTTENEKLEELCIKSGIVSGIEVIPF